MLTDTGDMLHVFCHNNSRMSERHFELYFVVECATSFPHYAHIRNILFPLYAQSVPKVWHISERAEGERRPGKVRVRNLWAEGARLTDRLQFGGNCLQSGERFSVRTFPSGISHPVSGRKSGVPVSVADGIDWRLFG